MVVHQDDIGMCHGANQAFLELSASGVVGSGSVMVPCPWFHEIALAAAAEPALDLGVHLTLNSEKPQYKWRPLTTPPASSGLTDPDGFFWRDVASTRRHCDPAAAETEMRAQVERALSAGIDVTHLDAHMGAALAPEFCDAYLRLGVEFDVPVLLTLRLADYGPRKHLAAADEARYDETVARARSLGFIVFDRVLETNWHRTTSAEEWYTELFTTMPAGLTFVAMHFNAPGDVEAIEPHSAHIRIAEYELFSDPAFRDLLAAQEIEFLGCRELRDHHRATRPPR
ncbi:MAG: ChbG/HpnK family deacetylase [Acidimicrobiia bacterium]